MRHIFIYLKGVLNLPGLYILLWCIVFLIQQELVSVPVIGQISLIVVLFWSIFAFCKVSSITIIPYIKGSNLLIILFTIYGLLLIIDTPVVHVSFNNKNNPTYWYIQSIFKSILPIYAFFNYTILGKLKVEDLRFWTFVYLILAYFAYMATYQDVTSIVETFSETNRTNSLAYLFIAIIPCIPLFNNKLLLQYSLFTFCLSMALLGMKRGAIIVGIICFIWFIRCTLNGIFQAKSKLKFIFIIILIVTLVYALFYIYNSLLSDNLYFLQRIEQTLEGGTSGRDKITDHFLSYYSYEMNIIEKILGIGAYGTVKTYSNFAHNDWIEILICQGILGIICYVFYWVNLFKTIKCNTHIQQAFQILSLFAIIQFFKTFFSMSIDDMNFFTTSAVGYALGQIYLTHKSKIINNET